MIAAGPNARETSEIARQLDNVPLFQGLAADALARIRERTR